MIDVFGQKENLTILLKSNDDRIKRGSVINYSESFYKVNQIVPGRFERVGLEVTKLDEHNGNKSQ
ncbi:MAG: hypothetical protein EKK64_04775 [Neisseriaceae bacterium]|nr:MAG: hypothetical protein EKK64_04775 [Neisseriaceae bacterium]